MQWMVSGLTFLTRYDNEKNCFLKSIFAGDKTWILNKNPETKEQTKQ